LIADKPQDALVLQVHQQCLRTCDEIASLKSIPQPSSSSTTTIPYDSFVSFIANNDINPSSWIGNEDELLGKNSFHNYITTLHLIIYKCCQIFAMNKSKLQETRQKKQDQELEQLDEKVSLYDYIDNSLVQFCQFMITLYRQFAVNSGSMKAKRSVLFANNIIEDFIHMSAKYGHIKLLQMLCVELQYHEGKLNTRAMRTRRFGANIMHTACINNQLELSMAIVKCWQDLVIPTCTASVKDIVDIDKGMTNEEVEAAQDTQSRKIVTQDKENNDKPQTNYNFLWKLVNPFSRITTVNFSSEVVSVLSPIFTAMLFNHYSLVKQLAMSMTFGVPQVVLSKWGVRGSTVGTLNTSRLLEHISQSNYHNNRNGGSLYEPCNEQDGIMQSVIATHVMPEIQVLYKCIKNQHTNLYAQLPLTTNQNKQEESNNTSVGGKSCKCDIIVLLC